MASRFVTKKRVIRAKRVSNCYIQKKKSVICACVCVCSTNIGFSGEKKLCVCSTNLGFSGIKIVRAFD